MLNIRMDSVGFLAKGRNLLAKKKKKKKKTIEDTCISEKSVVLTELISAI